jgi:26S proteasome regulatory subunit N6
MEAMDVVEDVKQNEEEEEEQSLVVEVKEMLSDAKNTENGDDALKLLNKISDLDDKGYDQVKKWKGIAIVRKGTLLAKLGRTDQVLQLTKNSRKFLQSIPKARTAKIVRDLIVGVSEVPGTVDLQEKLCVDSIKWCKEQKRNFLRQRLETRHAAVMRQLGRYDEAIGLLRRLQREVKKIDDKQLLVEINLVESRVQFNLKNMPKAKAALTAARTNANAIYVQPSVQAEIDHQAGVLHSDERDYKTAYSYFFEAFEGRNNMKDHENASKNLKYMLLCKIMMEKAHEVPATVGNKSMLVYAGKDVDAMLAVASAYKRRSLHDLEKTLETYKDQLARDDLIKLHLKDLSERLLEANLCRIIEPYSRVEIAHVASLIKLPIQRVETKLSQMILDKKFHGILNQGKGELLVQEPLVEDRTFENGLKVVRNMSEVVGTLLRRADKLNRSN